MLGLLPARLRLTRLLTSDWATPGGAPIDSPLEARILVVRRSCTAYVPFHRQPARPGRGAAQEAARSLAARQTDYGGADGRPPVPGGRGRRLRVHVARGPVPRARARARWRPRGPVGRRVRWWRGVRTTPVKDERAQDAFQRLQVAASGARTVINRLAGKQLSSARSNAASGPARPADHVVLPLPLTGGIPVDEGWVSKVGS